MNKSSLVQTPNEDIATAADFEREAIKALFEVIVAAEIQKVRLPKYGLKVLLRHPGPLAVENMFGEYRDLLAAMRAEADANEARPVPERQYAKSIVFADFVQGLMARLFVSPVIGHGQDEVPLRRILPDFAFISRWLEGEVVVGPDGSADDLGPFPGRSGAAAGAGVHSAAEPVPPQPIA